MNAKHCKDLWVKSYRIYGNFSQKNGYTMEPANVSGEVAQFKQDSLLDYFVLIEKEIDS